MLHWWDTILVQYAQWAVNFLMFCNFFDSCFFKAAIIKMSVLTMNHMNTCMWKGSLVIINPQRIITQCCSPSQLFRALEQFSAHCFGFPTHSFKFWFTLIALISVREKPLKNQLYANCSAPNSWKTKWTKWNIKQLKWQYLSQELVETKTDQNGECLLDLHSSDGYKHKSLT